MGRRPKFASPRQFERLVGKYFDSIRRVEPALEKRLVYAKDERGRPLLDAEGGLITEKDEYGHDRMRWEAVKTADGRLARREVWLEPPSVTGLCNALGISRETWREYAGKEGFAEVITAARQRIEAYLQTRMIEDGKAARGAMFSLQYNFGWKNRSEVSLDGPTRAAVAAAPPRTLEDNLALLQTLGMKLPWLEEGECEGVRENESTETV